MKLFAERRLTFPDPRRALAEGVVDVSDDLSVARLLEAYSFGIYPWPTDGYPTLWFCPERRGILEFKDFHVARSLRKALAKNPFTYSIDRDFAGVINACAEAPRLDQPGTWITGRMVDAYVDFHRAGYAHSVEVWEGDALVGGLYGVYVAGNFSGESMFHRATGASKAGLVFLVDTLEDRGLEWMDIQMVTPLLETFGATYVSRDAYLQRLARAKRGAKPIDFTSNRTT